MRTKNLEMIYNEIPFQVKETVGFPDSYIFLTNAQEQFIIDLYETEREVIKEMLLETLDEMKGLVDEL